MTQGISCEIMEASKGGNMTALQFFLDAFNWQGGTIHQVSAELQRVGLSKELTSVSSLIGANDNALKVIRELYWMKSGRFKL